MIPENRLSEEALPTTLRYPKNLPTDGLEAFDMGGVALNDSSQGLLVKAWRAFVVGEDVFVEADDVPAAHLFSASGISTISLTFDQNMNPFVAFTDLSGAKFYWFDTLEGMTKITSLPAGSSWPRCSLDDKRDFASGYSDIILGYIRDGNLVYSQQRDRYTIEYALFPDLNTYIGDPRIREIGMDINYRFQFNCEGAYYPL